MQQVAIFFVSMMKTCAYGDVPLMNVEFQASRDVLNQQWRVSWFADGKTG